MTAITSKATSKTLAARIERAAQMAYLDGATEAAISKTLGIKLATIKDWKKRPEWRRTIGQLRTAQEDAILDRLFRLTEKAAQAIEDCLSSESDAIRLKAAQWLLDRGTSLGDESRHSTGDVNGTGEIEQFVKLVMIDAKAKLKA